MYILLFWNKYQYVTFHHMCIALSVGTEYMLQIVDVNTKSQIQITANAGYQNF